MSNIIWLASYPKSGNTWVRSFLGSVFETRGQFSMESMKRVSAQCVSKTMHKRVLGTLPEYANFAEAVSDRPRILTELDKFLGTMPQYKALRFIKTHSMAGRFRNVPMIPPGLATRGLFIVRNPFDVCLSACNHFGFSRERGIQFMQDRNATMGELSDAATKYPLYLSSWANHTVSWLRRKDMKLHMVRYEDMSLYPLREFRRIAKQIADVDDEARILKALAETDFKSLAELEEKEGFSEASPKSEKFFRKGKVADGFSQLTPEQRDQLYKPWEKLCNALGYHYDGERFGVGKIDSEALLAISRGTPRVAPANDTDVGNDILKPAV